MSREFAAQIVGIIALIMWFASFQVRDNKKLFIVQTVANLIFGVQFILLKGYAGCFGLVLCSLRNILIINRDRWNWAKSWLWIGVIAVADAAFVIYTMERPIDMMAWVACVGASVTCWTNNARTIRLGNLFVASPSWLIYDIAYGAWPSAFSESMAMISVIISIFRFGWDELGKDKEDVK